MFNGTVFAALLLGFWLAAKLLNRKRFVDVIGAWNWRKYAAGAAIWILVMTVNRHGKLTSRWSAPLGVDRNSQAD
jgi:hypothetical protein